MLQWVFGFRNSFSITPYGTLKHLVRPSPVANSLFLSDLLPIPSVTLSLDVVADLVEGGGDGVKDTGSIALVLNVATCAEGFQNSRADNGQNKGSPRQVAGVILVGRVSSDVVRISRVAILVAVPRPCLSTIGPRKDRNRNESPNKGEIQQHPKPAKPLWSTALGKELEQRGQKRVQHSGSEDTFNRVVGTVNAAASLDAVDEAINLVHARGEEAEGDDC